MECIRISMGRSRQRVTQSLAAASRTLGRSPVGALKDLNLPLIRPALVSATLLIFVECIEELLAALTIVAPVIIPMINLSRHARQETAADGLILQLR